MKKKNNIFLDKIIFELLNDEIHFILKSILNKNLNDTELISISEIRGYDISTSK